MKYELTPINKSLNYQVMKLSLILGRELTKALKEFDITPERWQILAALWEAEKPLKQTELAEITFKDRPSISRLVESMIKTGWVVRKACKEDGRAFLVRTSARANSRREEIVSALYEHFQPFFDDFDKKNQAELSALVLKYIDVIEKGHNK